MNKIALFSIVLIFSFLNTQGQELHGTQETFVHGGVAFGEGALTTFGLYHNWNSKKRKRTGRSFFIGTGVRFTGFGGKNVSYTSAPPSLYGTSDATTLLAPEPSIYAINTFISLGYNFNPKVQMGFDLDLLGLSFGPQGNPKYIQNPGDTSASSASPTPINLMLVGARDRGTLQGGPFFRYKFTNRFSARAKIHTLFTELTTTKILQTIPEENKRFRNSSVLFGIGASYFFHRF